MGLAIVVSGGNALANGTSFRPPAIASQPAASLLGWWYLGGNLAQSVKNWANLNAPATPIGAPTFASNYVSTDGGYLTGGAAKSFSSNVPDQTNLTLFAVARSNGPFNGGFSAPALLNAYNNGPAATGFYGCNLSIGGSAGATAAIPLSGSSYNNAGASGGANAQLPAQDVTTFKAFASRLTSAGVPKIFNLTAGTSATGPTLPGVTLPGVGPIEIGSSPHRVSGGPADIALAAIYSAALSDNDVTAVVYPFIKTAMAALGITV